VVLVKDMDAFQRSWPLGRIVEVYPGPDGLTCAVTVKTQSGFFRRPIVKLVPLLKNNIVLPGSSPEGGGCSGQPHLQERQTPPGSKQEDTNRKTL